MQFTPEQRSFLLDIARTAQVATVRKDGRPHIAPVWFDLDGDTVVFMTGATSVKGRNIQRDPRITLSIDDARPPYAYLTIEGTATIDEDPTELLKWGTQIGGRYMGTDRAEEYGKRNGVPGELIIRVTPTKILFDPAVAS